jgi:hypothetical protein
MSCASSTTAKSKGGDLLDAMAPASLVNISETVIMPLDAISARTRAKMDQRVTRNHPIEIVDARQLVSPGGLTWFSALAGKMRRLNRRL